MEDDEEDVFIQGTPLFKCLQDVDENDLSGDECRKRNDPVLIPKNDVPPRVLHYMNTFFSFIRKVWDEKEYVKAQADAFYVHLSKSVSNCKCISDTDLTFLERLTTNDKKYSRNARIEMCSTDADRLLKQLDSLLLITQQCLKFIQESELISRGFTLISHRTPVSRLELKDGAALRQAARLRHLLFVTLRDLMLRIKTCTGDFLMRRPLPRHLLVSELELARVPLEDYGECVRLQDEEDLARSTDHFSLGSLRGMRNLLLVHVSELLRTLVLSAKAPNHSDAFYHAYAFVSRLTDDVTASSASLAESLALHKQVAFGGDCEPRAENEVWKSEKVKALHTAVRSLDLHLLAALQRVRHLAESLTPDTQEVPGETERELHAVAAELGSCSDCVGESLTRLPNKVKVSQGQPVGVTSPPISKEASVVIEAKQPVIEDEVFEAYIDEVVEMTNDRHWDDDETLNARAAEAARVLSELRSVIAQRSDDMRLREERALLRARQSQGVDAAPTTNGSAVHLEGHSCDECGPDADLPAAQNGCHVDCGETPEGDQILNTSKGETSELPSSLHSVGSAPDDDVMIGDNTRNEAQEKLLERDFSGVGFLAAQAARRGQTMASDEQTFGDSDSDQ